MPNAWDITAKGGAPDSGGCAAGAYGTVDSQCKKVYNFLSKQANSLSTYATNPHLGGGGRAVEAVQLQRLGERDLRSQPDLLRTGQADPQEVHRAALHLGLGGVQRPGRGQGDRGLPAGPRRHPGHHQSAEGRSQQSPSRQLQPRPAVHVVDQLLPLQLPHQGNGRQRSSTSCTSARPSSTWSTSRSTSRRSTRATPSEPTARCR